LPGGIEPTRPSRDPGFLSYVDPLDNFKGSTDFLGNTLTRLGLSATKQESCTRPVLSL